MQKFHFNIDFARYDGIIARMALILERRGFSICSLTISDLVDHLNMDLVVSGDPKRYEHVKSQLHKLVDVISLKEESLQEVNEMMEESVAA